MVWRRDAERDLHLRFLRSPAALLPAAGDPTAVGGLRVEAMRLEMDDGRQRAVGTGQFQTLEVRMPSHRRAHDAGAHREHGVCRRVHRLCTTLRYIITQLSWRMSPQALPHSMAVACVF